MEISAGKEIRFLGLRRSGELVLVAAGTSALALYTMTYPVADIQWWALPCCLVTGAVLPTLLGRRKLSHIGLNLGNFFKSLQLLTVCCLIFFPAVLALAGFLYKLDCTLPLMPIVAKDSWARWVLYQFFYVALAEEIFFRGYILSLLKEMQPASGRIHRRWDSMIIIFSAGLFACAHVFLLGNLLSVITFFPGLILGWLFLRTRSLLAPILFHGLANTFYAFIGFYLQQGGPITNPGY